MTSVGTVLIMAIVSLIRRICYERFHCMLYLAGGL